MDLVKEGGRMRGREGGRRSKGFTTVCVLKRLTVRRTVAERMVDAETELLAKHPLSHWSSSRPDRETPKISTTSVWTPQVRQHCLFLFIFTDWVINSVTGTFSGCCFLWRKTTYVGYKFIPGWLTAVEVSLWFIKNDFH